MEEWCLVCGGVLKCGLSYCFYCFFRGWGGKVVLATMGDGRMGTDQTLTTSPASVTRRRGLSPLSLGE